MTAAGPATRYPIRAVAKLTGLPLDTLRAWERRYQAVTPSRDGRQRLYSDADVARLKLLGQVVASGHAIGRAATLSDGELRALLDTHAAADAAARPVSPASRAGSRALSRALASLDSATIDAEFAGLAVALPPVELVRDVLMPAIRASGEDWMREPGRIGREHLVSATMRHLMGSFLRLFARQRGTTRLLFATPSGDHHELGILGAALLAASAGTDVTYLGPDLPASEIVTAATAARAQVVVLGLTLATRDASTVREVRALARLLPTGIELWVGGAGGPRFAQELGPRARILPDFDAYLAQLARIGHPHA